MAVHRHQFNLPRSAHDIDLFPLYRIGAHVPVGEEAETSRHEDAIYEAEEDRPYGKGDVPRLVDGCVDGFVEQSDAEKEKNHGVRGR